MKRNKRITFLVLILAYTAPLYVGGMGLSNGYQDEGTKRWNDWLKKYPPSNGGSELLFEYSFPNDALRARDIYFWDPRQLATDDEGNVYVLDNKWKSIFKFDSKGGFIGKAGSHGQGPGEFMNPFCICANNRYIVVSDTSKYDIQLFDFDLKYAKSFRVFKAYIQIAASDSGLILGVPMRVRRDAPLVDVLDNSGKLLYSFGEGMFGNDKDWLIPNWVFIDKNKENEIYLAFKHFPTVCKYTLNGNLIKMYDVDNKYMNYTKNLNIEAIEKKDNRTYTTTITGLRAGEKGFYILQGYPYIGIREFDENGNCLKEYWSTRGFDYVARDFLVDKNQKRIFVLEKDPKGEIEVFRPKKP